MLPKLPSWFDNIQLENFGYDDLTVRKTHIMNKLNIIMEPSIETVVKQLQILSSEVLQLLPKSNNAEDFKYVYKQFYDFLTNKHEMRAISSDNLKQLGSMPVLFAFDKIESKLLVPAKVSFDKNYSSEIEPYLFKYPRCLGDEYDILFKALGCTEEFTLSQYCSVLEDLWKETEGKPFSEECNPNDIIAIKKAMHCLLSRLESATPEEIGKVSKIYVFTEGKFLVNITSTYYFDLNFQKRFRKQQYLKRLGNLNDLMLDISGAKNPPLSFSNFNLDSLFSKLPQNLKPVPLSSVLHEQITKESLANVTLDESKSGVQLAQHFEKQFSSESLVIPIARLLSWNSKYNDAYKKLHWKNEDELFAFVSKLLGRLNFICCCGLKSILFIGGEVQENSIEMREYLVTETNDIYFNDESNFDLLKSEKQLTTKLSHKINELFSNQFEMFNHTLKKIIKTTDKNKWKAVLEDLGISELDNEYIHSAYLPEPGTLIPVALHCQLRHCFSTFNKGDYVGFELEDPVEAGCKGEPKIIYALVENEIVENDRPSSDHLKVYSVRISADEIINIPAAMLYKFWKSTHHEIVDIPQVIHRSDEETLQDVTKMLHDIHYLPVGLQNKIVKRLQMQWIPESNQGKEDLCQHITSLINQHCNLNSNARDRDSTYQSDSTIQLAWERASTIYKNSSEKVNYVRANELNEYLIQRTKVHKANQKCYEKNLQNSQKLSRESHFYLPKPDCKLCLPLQARKLFMQVEHDLEILECSSPDSDWTFVTCYLVSSSSNTS